MSLSGGALAVGSPAVPDHVARPQANDVQVLGFWDSKTAVITDRQSGHLNLSLRTLNPRAYGVSQVALQIPDVSADAAPVSFVPIDEFTALLVTGAVGAAVDETSDNHHIEHNINVVRRSTNNFVTIGPRTQIAGAVWNLVDDVDVDQVFIPTASLGGPSSFRLVCGRTAYPRPTRLGYILKASLSGDSLTIEQPTGSLPAQYYASRPRRGYVATIGAGGAVVWSDAYTSVTLDPDAGRYMGGRPVIVADDPTFMAWTGGEMSTYNPTAGEVRICKAEGVGPSVISDPISLPVDIVNPGPFAQPENLIVDVELAQAPLDPGRVPIVAVMSEEVAARGGGFSGNAYVTVFGAIADLRDKPVLRTDWVRLTNFSKGMIVA